jgi:hypothetical protein
MSTGDEEEEYSLTPSREGPRRLQGGPVPAGTNVALELPVRSDGITC